MSVPLLKFKNENENTDASRQQERILEAEIQQQEFENKVNNVLGIEELNQEIYGKKSAQVIPIFSPSAESLKGNQQDLFTIESLIEIVGIGSDSEEITQLLEKAIDDIDTKIAKDKSQAKKYVKQLQAIMAVIEQVAARQRNAGSNLQNSLKQMQDKLSNALKQDNPEDLRKLLKSNEMKEVLQKGLSNAAKNPELTRDMASRQQVADKSSQLGQESRQNSLSQMLNRVMDKFMDRGREMLGVQHRMTDSGFVANQQNINARAMPQSAAMQNNASMLAGMQAARMVQQSQSIQQSVAQQQVSQIANVNREQVQSQASNTVNNNTNLKANLGVNTSHPNNQANEIVRHEQARGEVPQANRVEPSHQPSPQPNHQPNPLPGSPPSVQPTDNKLPTNDAPPTTAKPDPNKVPECCKAVSKTASEVINSGFKLTPEQEKQTFKHAEALTPKVQEVATEVAANQQTNSNALLNHLRASASAHR